MAEVKNLEYEKPNNVKVLLDHCEDYLTLRKWCVRESIQDLRDSLNWMVLSGVQKIN